ncbi:glutathione S-transferase N-terminal domain-containing protein [Fodinicurvata sp. EGI_FJ10296]|uniref:glutathione S-transferase N-terminal domain-containing protein n=1 Tax=Fodinicurvata sp. EGI_FJ10296 TaxID=3231908 RepID=UPI003452B314
MKLYGSTRSPFVRKVRVVSIAIGLGDRLELTPADPWSGDGVGGVNPLGKIPALETRDGFLLYDSPVICAYLNDLGGGGLVPPDGPAKWHAMRHEAIADGICDAAVLRRLELARPDGERSDGWAARQAATMKRGCAALNAEVDALEAVTTGSLAVAVMLAYLDFRWSHEPWRDDCPELAAWFEPRAKTEMMTATAFAP